MNKNIKVAFQMDALKDLNFNGDTTYIFMQEAYKRGLEVYFYNPKSLAWIEGIVVARLSKVTNVLDSLGFYETFDSSHPIFQLNMLY